VALSKAAAAALLSMGEQLGLDWQFNTRRTRGTDEMLNICIGDGLAPTKIDGWIHACTLTAKAIAKYAADPDAGLDIVGITSWTGGNSALRYARWQADFHWKIDTRPWQFFLYMFPMKWAFRDNIKANTSLSDEDRQALLEVNEGFWEEVVCAYAYRSEVIERSRGFAPHPDPTCGSSWQGYPYRKIWERDDVPFSQLALPFIEKGGYDEHKGTEGKIEPRPFPAVENQVEPGVPAIALEWLRAAQERQLCDSWLRLKLGARWVPTRFNGWWASLDEVARFLEPFAKGQQAPVQVALPSRNCDLSDYAVRFALCHAEFYRRMKGEAAQLVGLIEAGRAALKNFAREKGLPEAPVDAFINRAVPVIQQALATQTMVDGEELPELHVARPLHPRFAPVDPLEPLPWQVTDTQRYLKKMAQLGYTI
jgi:hypothetical protein